MARLPILMYHKVSPSHSEGLTISVSKLEEQFRFLKQMEYHTHHLSELVSVRKLEHPRNIVITFDDGYVNQLELAYPLLQKYGLKATFFIPIQYIGKSDAWNSPSEPIMTAEQLDALDPSVVELGYHSYAHQKYNEMSADEWESDTAAAFEVARKHSLPIGPTLAFPYGKFPRKQPQKGEFVQFLADKGFELAFRIGNRVNNFPFRNKYEIQRIDVKGEFSLKKFRRKIKYGKLL